MILKCAQMLVPLRFYFENVADCAKVLFQCVHCKIVKFLCHQNADTFS